MKIIKKAWLPLIGILLFAYIISKVDLAQTFKILRKINIPIFLISVVIYILYFIIRVVKWDYLMRQEGIYYKFKDSLTMYFVGLYLGLTTPGRIGDFSKILYMRNDGYSTKKAFITVFLDRISDIFFLFLSGYLAMFVFYEYFMKEIYWISIFITLTIIIILIFFINKERSKRFIELVFNFLIPKNYKEKFKFSFSEFFEDLESINKKVLFNTFLITIVSWVLVFICYYFVALSIGIEIPFLYLVACISISTIVTLLPISISGIGTRDAVIIMLFSFIGISKELAVSFSLIVLFYIILIAFIGLFCWFKKPLRIGKKTQEEP